MGEIYLDMLVMEDFFEMSGDLKRRKGEGYVKIRSNTFR